VIYKPYDNQWSRDVEYVDELLDSGVATTGAFAVVEAVFIFIYDEGSFELGELILGTIGKDWPYRLHVVEEPDDLTTALFDVMMWILHMEEAGDAR
jgi:hypothetical protein